MSEKQKWVVTRQCYYGAEYPYTVEIAFGGLDYANPDMYCTKYPGEGDEYTDPREAAQTALEIAKQWQTDEPDKDIGVAYGSTGGYTLPFEKCEEAKLLAWAEKRWEDLPKCQRCGEVMGEEGWMDAYGEITMCSEYCSDKNHEELERLNREEAEE